MFVNMYHLLRNTIHFDTNITGVIKPVELEGVSTKQFQSAYSISPVAVTTVYCPVIFGMCCPFPNKTF